MKIKVLVTFLIVVAFMSIGFASSLPQTAIPVTATQTAPIIGSTLSGIVLTKGGIFHYDGVSTSGVVMLYITSTLTPDYTFTAYTEFNGTINTKTNEGVISQKMVWKYINDGQVIGTFEGEAKVTTTTYLYNPATGYPRPQFSTNIYHTILQGTGMFKGQTLKLDGIRLALDVSMPVTTPANPVSWEGVLLTH
jgi:hypothetical protein